MTTAMEQHDVPVARHFEVVHHAIEIDPMR